MLYQVLEQYWSEFQERAAEQGGLPRFVRREVEEYLRCGRLEYGCLRLCCEQCGHQELVALSCCPERETMRSRGEALVAQGWETIEFIGPVSTLGCCR